MEIKPIETAYKGYRFRSRLEARWAVFFDALGIDWDYELEGYKLSSGVCYLPDFWLPTFDGGMYCEVKPKGAGNFLLAGDLCLDTKRDVWLCRGVPDFTVQMICRVVQEGKLDIWLGVPNFWEAKGENRMYYVMDGEEIVFDDKDYAKAVTSARSARFEYGG